MLRHALAGAVGVGLVGSPALRALASPRRSTKRKGRTPARSVIQIWQAGGPTHIDTFDPKPDAGKDYTGPLTGTADTPVAGMRLGQALPLLAKQAKRYSLLRSVTHMVNGHETAAYIVQTGRRPGSGESSLVFPSFGAVVAALNSKDYHGVIPPHVVLTRPMGRFATEGFLGLAHKPFVTGGDPRQPRFAVEGIVQANVSDERQRSRRELLHGLDTLGRAVPDDPSFARLDEAEGKAYDLILGDAGKVFDLSGEKDELRDRYGRTTFGQSCLVARRLVEQGVPYVTINSGGWDTHKRHFETMRQRLPDLDHGLSTLLEDLADHGLLDSTIVWCCGEFGRTPKVMWEEPWNGGRGHHGQCFSALVAGGGFEGGHVVGASDEHAELVAERPIAPHELLGSMYTLLGIDPAAPLPNPRGLDVKILPPIESGPKRGLLQEIMA
jgi:hypothetical protein